MRRAGRVDAHQAELVEALRRLGWRVHLTSGVGDGFPDAVAWHQRMGLILIEFKTPRGRFTRAQDLFHREFPVHVVRSLDDLERLWLR